MIDRLADYPGISPRADLDARGYFEEAYDIGDGFVMRARFTPIHDETGIAASLPIATLPKSIFVSISRSLVDEDGQVLYIAGRGLVTDPTAHKVFADSTLPNTMAMEDWLDQEAGRHVAELKQVYVSLQANAFLIVPPDRVPSPTGEVTDPETAAAVEVVESEPPPPAAPEPPPMTYGTLPPVSEEPIT